MGNILPFNQVCCIVKVYIYYLGAMDNESQKNSEPGLDYTAYYIVQTVPFFKVCGLCLDEQLSEKAKKKVEEMTGGKAFSIAVTRDELKQLSFKL